MYAPGVCGWYVALEGVWGVCVLGVHPVCRERCQQDLCNVDLELQQAAHY